ncbi:BTB/POZ domain-containing protein [Candidatus Protochlamydia sp. W-9]|uniref:BTB/POZ domain-containing protein n=1 Tax=Candidatus Protochlamydia sp. W-9 TaxID=1785087 RepID=UPI00096A7858|nr:BTB/POZ domain-containing protein [Candidatus Protochlamydia sp. W-9]
MNISNFGFNSSHLIHTTAPSYYHSQNVNELPEEENNSLDNPLANTEETSAPTIQPSALSPSSEEVQLSFQEGTSLTISHSQLALLREKSLYFKTLWSGNFQETLQHPLDLTKKDFTLLLNCLTNPKFEISLEEIFSSIQLTDYYGLTDVVKHLEEQLIDGYKSQKFEPFNSTEESLIELKKLLNIAHRCQLNTLKNYLEFTFVSALLNQTSQLAEFERIINHFSKKIERLNFSNQAYLTNAHLLALKDCKKLKVIHLEACQALTDDGLEHLTLLTSLQHLDLRVCEYLTDDGLAYLKPLTALQHLDLSGCWNLTDAGLVHLTPLVGLQHLDLSYCEDLTDAGLAHLTPLTALQHLGLNCCENLTDAGLAHLALLTALQHLYLSCCYNLTDASLSHLTPLTALQRLDLRYCENLTDAGLAHLTPLTALQHLNLSRCYKLTDAGLAHLTPLVALQHLNLSKCNKLTDDGLERFKNLAVSLNLKIKLDSFP